MHGRAVGVGVAVKEGVVDAVGDGDPLPSPPASGLPIVHPTSSMAAVASVAVARILRVVSMPPRYGGLSGSQPLREVDRGAPVGKRPLTTSFLNN